jgi:RHS repeat-associated protein
MTYPDGELLSYTYDSGGLVTSATGVKEGVTYPYFDGVQYDKAGNRTSLHYGNGLLTQTSYAPDTRWFSDQKVTMGQTTLSDLHYRYDKAGNVLERNDTRPLPPVSDLGGPSAQTFRYDDLHRLTSATGTYMSPPTKKREYSFALTYDDAGRVVNKTQKDQVNGITQKDTTYNLGYEYKGAAPHAPSKIGDRNYRFDADGNVTKWTMDKSSVNRAVTWDEADRMTRVTDQSSTTDLRYDDADELAILRGPQGEIEFVNDTFVQHNGAGAWKTVLLNDVPVATKRVDNTPELKQYWMTGDLLDSVNLVTDSNGKLFEHSLYLPSGEMWFWEKSTVYREPFLFAGSWFDEFRRLNSMEARWYEPRDGIMYSPDPILEGDVDEAVLEPRLLGSYTYGFDNPELYVDDSGEQATSNQGAHQATFGHRFRERLTALREKKHRVESEGRVGRFNARIERMQDSRGYEALENVLEGSMVQIELSFDGSLKINPKIMGVGLDDIKKLRKKKAKV